MSAGLDCDVSVASGGARFKSTVLRYLADIDVRFGALVRLVKLWAGAHGMNDATAGTFNSFALTLMVSHWTAQGHPSVMHQSVRRAQTDSGFDALHGLHGVWVL